MAKSMADWIAEKTADVEVGTIPYSQAGFAWDLERKRDWSTVVDLHVVDIGAANQGVQPDATIWDKAGSTLGACMGEWRDGRNPRHTPLGRFAEMCFDGHMPAGEEFARVLREFAKIEGADWAVHMLAALKMGDMLHDDEEWRL